MANSSLLRRVPILRRVLLGRDVTQLQHGVTNLHNAAAASEAIIAKLCEQVATLSAEIAALRGDAPASVPAAPAVVASPAPVPLPAPPPAPRGIIDTLRVLRARTTDALFGAADATAKRNFIGYLGTRSTHHVTGWLHDSGHPDDRLGFDVVCALPGAERTLVSAVADQYSPVLEQLKIGDARYAFRVVFPAPISAQERDHLEIRPHGAGRIVPHEPNMRTRWEPVRFVAMDVVDNCNLRCPFCLYDYTAVNRTNIMSDEVYQSALRLLPYTSPEHFWLSCLHEPTMHPRFTDLIAQLPRDEAGNVFFTTNVARRMPPAYYETLANSGINHINISIESRTPEIYEKLRKGARFRIFMENWDILLAAFAAGAAPPQIRYIVMAYKSNFREIPELIEYLRRERRAWNVEIRYSFDMTHIPPEFCRDEFLDNPDWRWLKAQLAHYSVHDVLLSLPPDFSDDPAQDPLPYADPARPRNPIEAEKISTKPATAKRNVSDGVAELVEVRIAYNGNMSIIPVFPGQTDADWSKAIYTNILEIKDPAGLVKMF